MLMRKIPWNEPKFGKFELDLVKDVLESGYVSEGPITKELEERLAKIIGCKYVIMTTSCTSALYLAAKAIHNLNGQCTNTFILPSLTFVGTKNAMNMIKFLDTYVFDVDDKRFILDIKKEPPILKGPSVIPIFVNILGRGVDKKIIEDLKLKEVQYL
jgi:dTDP-4-amino-4,6-dideoxygalactose transaminase